MIYLNWENPIQVRLNDNDKKIIEDFLNLIEQSDDPGLAKANQSEFIRICITFTIFMITFFMNFSSSKSANKLIKIQENLVKELAEGKTDSETAVSIIKFTQKQLMPLIKKEAKEIGKKVTPLGEKRKPGAPKKLKRDRGRPKDLGYGK